MSQQVQPVQLVHPDGKRRVDFTWNGDRFIHQLVCGDSVVESFEEAEELPWPASPPLQQLSVEVINDQEVALGVGCAGTSHWSLSVQPIENGFHFEWACRTKVSPERLLSTYQIRGTSEPAWNLEPVGSSTRTDGNGVTELKPTASLSEAGTFQWAYTATA
ncbi:hypothetical protein LOC67_19295 [Stieleria sp. JC731]|uniref:hypothetical protein n=1 Tax=Pirellulaceae TaxID=2691357 RepID=UPI001E4797CC|nr:hypothetical protein [Stieleria sp. JC731]MCC9602702.1 hypothetical protein [Stieleria sp. JC731]